MALQGALLDEEEEKRLADMQPKTQATPLPNENEGKLVLGPRFPEQNREEEEGSSDNSQRRYQRHDSGPDGEFEMGRGRGLRRRFSPRDSESESEYSVFGEPGRRKKKKKKKKKKQKPREPSERDLMMAAAYGGKPKIAPKRRGPRPGASTHSNLSSGSPAHSSSNWMGEGG